MAIVEMGNQFLKRIKHIQVSAGIKISGCQQRTTPDIVPGTSVLPRKRISAKTARVHLLPVHAGVTQLAVVTSWYGGPLSLLMIVVFCCPAYGGNRSAKSPTA